MQHLSDLHIRASKYSNRNHFPNASHDVLLQRSLDFLRRSNSSTRPKLDQATLFHWLPSRPVLVCRLIARSNVMAIIRLLIQLFAQRLEFRINLAGPYVLRCRVQHLMKAVQATYLSCGTYIAGDSSHTRLQR